MSGDDKKVPWWKARSSYGRTPNFENPEDFLDAGLQYFEWLDANPYYRSEFKTVSQGGNLGSEIEEVKIPVMRPATMFSLCLFMGITLETFSAKAQDPRFSDVTSMLREAVTDEKLRGAMAGFYNASIISRHLGLKDASEVSGKIETDVRLPAEAIRSELSDMFKAIKKRRKAIESRDQESSTDNHNG